MEKFSARRLATLLFSLALLLGAFAACHKKSGPATPAQSAAPGSGAEASPPEITGPVTPALVKQNDPNSITHYLHFPKDPAVAKVDGAVQFFCDLTETGNVETTHALVAKNDAFKQAVQTALDWGRFTPATVNGKAVRAYLGGTILFLHQNGSEVIVVSLATHDRDRVGKMANYIQPQLIGGLRHALEKEIASLTKGILVAGKAEVVVKVDAKGKVTGTSSISENPKGSGLGLLLDAAMKKSHFTPAYENGTAAPGGVNIVADFSRF
ncbi:MAG TPA: energy transducer TonB [Chthoniobacterales bacterium]